MKKLLVLLSLLVLSSCGSFPWKAQTFSGSGISAGEEEVDTQSVNSPASPQSDWKVYSNEKLGISFMYPEGEVQVNDKVPSFDKGKRLTVSTPDFSFTATSADYTQGAGEGCCYYYAAKSLDTRLGDDEIRKILDTELKGIYEFSRIYVNGKDAFRFFRISQYVSAMPVWSVILPVPGGVYANIMFNGPDLGDFTKGEDGTHADRAGAIAYINSQKYKEDKEFQAKLDRFEAILKTFKFN